MCFTTTAMPRPELLELTYASFSTNLPWLDFKQMKLFLHLDRYPTRLDDSEDAKAEQVIEIAQKYFGEVVVKRGEYPNFSNAVKWIFTNADKDYIFNLEDDWELLVPLSNKFVQYFEDEKVLQVGLRGSQNPQRRFVLSPSIMRSKFAKSATAPLTPKKNPELTIRGWNPHHVNDSFIYWPDEKDYVILKDLGRSWMKTTAFGRGTDEWTTWKFLPNRVTRARQQQIEDQNLHINYEILKNIQL